MRVQRFAAKAAPTVESADLIESTAQAPIRLRRCGYPYKKLQYRLVNYDIR